MITMSFEITFVAAFTPHRESGVFDLEKPQTLAGDA